MTRIAVIGGGFSGSLLALHLLRQCPPATKVLLIERNSHFGRGVAFSTGNPSHLLNVPAGRMSGFHDKPDDFLNWLRTQPDGTGATAATFAPRLMFGAYVRALLSNEIARHGADRLELVHGEVLGLDRTGHPLSLTLDKDRTLTAEFAALAVGNFPPEPVQVTNTGFYDTAFYRPDPWAGDALTDLDPKAPVLLIGTGLTTVDAVISLLGQGHRGPIHAMSRRGLLPRRHASVPRPAPEHAPFPTSVNALARFVRREADRAMREGSLWQPVIDELRPFTVDVWQAMPLSDRKRFLRHLRPWWDVHRHRMAPQVADRLDGARDSGQFRLLVGRIRDYEISGDRVTVVYKPRGQDCVGRLSVARVVNCAGPGADYDRISDPLVRGLLRDGVVRPDKLRLGLDVTANCALLDRGGAISRRLYAVGPVTKGMFWEMTAVPDIRRQAEKLAEHIADLMKAAPKRA